MLQLLASERSIPAFLLECDPAPPLPEQDGDEMRAWWINELVKIHQICYLHAQAARAIQKRGMP